MNILKEIKKVTKATEEIHGVKTTKKIYQITKTGISKLSGKQTLSVPASLDIFIWLDGEIIPIIPFMYFQTVGVYEGSSYQSWETGVIEIMKTKNAQNGYYIVNHGNRRTKYLGVDWDAICDELDGKYISSDPYTAISDNPFNPEQSMQSNFNRQMGLI